MAANPFEGISRFDYLTGSYLAWDSIDGDRKRNRWLALIALLLTIGIVSVVVSIDVPKVDRAVAEKVPERLAKLVMEKKLEPPPPPPPKVEEKKEEEKPEEKKPEEKPTEVQVTKAKAKAEKAMAEAKKELSAMQDLTSAFDFGNAPLTKAGAAGPGNDFVARDTLTSRAGKGSGGVTMGTTSSGGGGYGLAGGGKLAGAQVAAVESGIASGGTGVTRKSASGKLERTEEEIRRMMDRNNGALQAIYQRALRANPTLKGQIVLRLVIAPDGSLTTADITSSELGDPETEKKLLMRIKLINFGAIPGVMVWDGKYTLNFFPS